MSGVEATFSFGRNWEEFIENHFTDEWVEISQQHILDFLQVDDLQGRYFMDVGCGSGLSSLAAYRAGASYIVSFDIDPFSVQTTRKLHEREGSPDNWTVLEGSILDKEFLATLEPADTLYSWGVLHHTGSMWEAIENTMNLMAPDGVFYVGLYVTTRLSDIWIIVKKQYNRGGKLTKQLLEILYLLYYFPVQIKNRRNPIANIRNYRETRGMDFMTDVRDWLGGWPYEDASVEEVQSFFHRHDWDQVQIATEHVVVEYLFTKK